MGLNDAIWMARRNFVCVRGKNDASRPRKGARSKALLIQMELVGCLAHG